MSLALAACGGDPTLEGTYEGKTTVPGMDYPPTWSLTITSHMMADGVVFVLGSWGISGIGLQAGGEISGTFDDPDLTLTFASASSANCGYNVSATWQGDEIEGTYSAMACFVVAEGSFSLSRK